MIIKLSPVILRVIKLNEYNSLLLIIKYMKKYNLKLVNTINFIKI